MRVLKLAMLLGAMLFTSDIYAETEERLDTLNPPRVGGIYKVVSIGKNSDETFSVEFESTAKSGNFDRLLLVSDHVYVGMEEGVTLRLSAEVLTVNGSSAEISQVLLFFPSGDTYLPVWMLSKKASGSELRGSKYLDMHAPVSDYTVF